MNHVVLPMKNHTLWYWLRYFGRRLAAGRTAARADLGAVRPRLTRAQLAGLRDAGCLDTRGGGGAASARGGLGVRRIGETELFNKRAAS